MPAQLGAKFDPENWNEWLPDAGNLTAIGQEKSSHEKTWNTQDNPLWQALRETGEAYRKSCNED